MSDLMQTKLNSAGSFTKEQLLAINHDCGNYTVSASAGSGKTRVMIERLIRLIVDGKVSVKEILAVTFTKASALEMSERLNKALIDRIKVETDLNKTKRLIKEQRDLPLASISTIDSFFNSLVRRYFYLLGVDSKFAIIAEGDVVKLKETALSFVLENLYDNQDIELINLLKIFAKKRSDNNLRKIILTIYNFTESENNIDDFFKSSLYLYTEDGLKSVENRLIDHFIEKIKGYNDDIYDLIYRAKSLNIDKYVDYLNLYLNWIDVLTKNKNVDTLIEFCESEIKKPPVKTKDDEAKKQLSCDIDGVKDSFVKLKAEISKTFSQRQFSARLEESEKSYEVLQSLLKIVRLFAEEYQKQKAEQNLMDYADLSRSVYKLLKTDEVINDLHSTYKYIFVDEYQDTNGIQEGVFRLLEKDNIFLVGDVKQSIYGFRGCDSNIFAKRVEEGQTNNAHVELNQNFRSASKVINCVNRVFSNIITPTTMGLDYAKHQMVYGGLYGDYEGKAELYYIDEAPQKQPLDLGVYSIAKHLESFKNQVVTYERLVAVLVNKALNQKVYDLKTQTTRMADYGDITILTRNNTGVERVVKELDMAGIPVISESKRSIKDYPEVQQLINILQYIYTDDDDIALATTLKSPIVGLSDVDLKYIANKNATSFYEATINASKVADNIGKKLTEFFAYMKRIKLLSAFEGVPTLLRRIIREKDFEASILSTRGGELKFKRMKRFIEAGYKGDREVFLSEFMQNLDAELEGMTISSSGGDNAVRVMSMHKSKGLEFPIVIIAELGDLWNNHDSREEVLCCHDGIGLRSYDHLTKTTTSTVQKAFIELRKKEDNLKDELRTFYVALTRAKCILYIATKKPPQKTHSCDLSLVSSQQAFLAETDMPVYPVTYEELLNMSEKEQRRKLIIPDGVPNLYNTIEKFINYKYPYESDITLSLKRSVTEVSKSKMEKDEGDLLAPKPLFYGSDIETGVVYHKFLELFDFSNNIDNGLIEGFLQKNFTKEQQDIIDIEKVKQILSLNIFNEIKDYKLYKEHPFIVSIPPKLANETGTEDILLQGIIDLLAIKGDKAIIIDYKHSGLGNDRLIERYHKQLELYKFAVEKSLNVKVVKKVLVNLMKVQEISID